MPSVYPLCGCLCAPCQEARDRSMPERPNTEHPNDCPESCSVAARKAARDILTMPDDPVGAPYQSRWHCTAVDHNPPAEAHVVCPSCTGMACLECLRNRNYHTTPTYNTVLCTSIYASTLREAGVSPFREWHFCFSCACPHQGYERRCISCGDCLWYSEDRRGYGTEDVCYTCYYGINDWEEEEEDLLDNGVLRSYGYTPRLRFLGDNSPSTNPTQNLYLGVELETEFNSRAECHAALTATMPLINGRAWYTHDSSLNCGAELTTMPMTPDYAHNQFPWQTLLRTLREHNARSTRACGIHIHLSKAAFTPPHLWRFLALHYTPGNPLPIQKLAGRGSVDFCSWEYSEQENKRKTLYAKTMRGVPRRPADRQYACLRCFTYGTAAEIGNLIVSHYVCRRCQSPIRRMRYPITNPGRYIPVNLQNSETIELRYFASTLRLTAMMRNLEWAIAAADYTRTLSVRDVANGGLQWPTVAEWVLDHSKDYSTLALSVQDARKEA